MKRYDHVVVGSGISGMTAALLLAMNRRRVLLIEKAPRMGGSLSRFYREGIPFDTGFHYTGGLAGNGLLRKMLAVLGVDNAVEPVFLSKERAHRFIFESEGRSFDLPCGIESWRRRLKADFPADAAAVDSYFDLVAKVCNQTVTMDLNRIGDPPIALDEDCLSLKTVLDRLTSNSLLKGLFCGLGMHYGVKPSEISFADHCRMCSDLYESPARIRNGGDALIMAFADKFNTLGIEVLCGRYIVECGPIVDGHATSFILDNGTEVNADSAILTIHPSEILRLLPEPTTSSAFRERVAAFESPAGVFSFYGVLDACPAPADFDSTVVSFFPTLDFDQLLDPGYAGEPALVLLGRIEQTRSGPKSVVTACEPSFGNHVQKWSQSYHGNRPPDYLDYKKQRSQAILRHLGRHNPLYESKVRVIDTASVLTFRDYLFSPSGGAYGIKQKIGQFNLIGRLPVRNLFAAGQSSLLPGLAGAMMSSFVVVHSVLGKDDFNRLINKRP